jgi:hypothetical protein
MSAVRIQIRRGTVSEWSNANPILAAGEIGFETNTNKIKVGDGTTHWNSLDYITAEADTAHLGGQVASDIAQALTTAENYTDTVVGNLTTTNIPEGTGIYFTARRAIDAVNAGLTPGSGIQRLYVDGNLTISALVRGQKNITTSVDSQTNNINIDLNDTVNISGDFISNSVTTGSIVATDITGTDLTLTGNLHVSGTTTTVNSNTLTVTDPMIYLGGDNTSNSLDLGIVASFTKSGTYQHTGLVRDAIANTWKLFKGVTDEPTTTINFAQASYDSLTLGHLEADTATLTAINVGDVPNETLQYLKDVSSNVQTQLNTKAPSASPTFTGSVVLPSNTISSSNLQDYAITNSKIGSGAITNSNISATANINISKILNLQSNLDTLNSTLQSNFDTLNSTLDSKSPSNNPTFTGTVVLPSTTSIGSTTSTEISYIHGATSPVQTQLNNVSDTISSHSSSTTNVHGISNTADLANKIYVDNALSTAESYTDTKISTEVTNRNTAISTAVTNLVNGAPSALDTLAEIASAIGNDANFSTTLTNSIALKSPLASPIFTGTVVLPTGTVTSGMILDGTIVNADINASAAIAATKISGTAVTQSDTGTIATGMIADSAITSAKIADGTIVNGDVNASAAIAYSKLNLASSIKSSDIVDGTIVNADINASAAIDATKISGTAVTQADTGTVTSTMIADGTIVNTDISSSAAIADTKLATISTSGKVSNSATTATDANTASAIVARDASGNFTANLITVNTTPTASGHAASKAYVDNISAGMNWHSAVQAATAGVLPSSTYAAGTIDANGGYGIGATLTATANAAIVIDTIALNNGNRVLVKDQADAKQNGIYVVTDKGSVSTKWILTRATDSDNHIVNQVEAGDAVYVLYGPNNLNQSFVATVIGSGTNGIVLIGTDNITWTQFSGASSFVAGNGLVRTGNTVDVVSSTLSSSADSLDLSTVSRSNTTGSATNNLISSITTDTYGRVTAAVTSPINVATSTQQGVATFNTASFTVTSGDVTIKSAGVSNTQLANSSVTVGSTAIALGSSATTIAGLTSVTSTGFTGALTGNADTATKLATTRAINGVNFDGSAAITITAANPNALTIGTGLSGTSYTGSAAVTIAIDSTVATLTGTQTLTNKTLTSPAITLPSAGITFSDSTIQTVAGVPSITPINSSVFTTGVVNLATGYKDYMMAVAASVTVTLQQDSSATYPIGSSVDFYATGTGALFAAGTSATIINTPGLKFRAIGSVATAMKVAANTWLVFGDLTA